VTDPELAALIAAADSLVDRAVRRRAGDRQAAAHGEVRRILDATLELMRADPAREVRIADVVRAAGVSNDAFYRAFRGKDELMAAVSDDGARRLLDDLERQLAAVTDPAERVRVCVRAILRQAADPETAATALAVLRHSPRRPRGATDIRTGVADLLREPYARLRGADPLMASCAVFGYLEHHLWAGSQPSAADIDRLAGWLAGG
jgi:AcrR family transcriptional regulator